MPSDLSQFEDEMRSMPERTRQLFFDRFAKYAPHLMPFQKNAYYTKQLELLEVDGLSAVYSSVDAGSMRNSINLQNALRRSMVKWEAKKNDLNEEVKVVTGGD